MCVCVCVFILNSVYIIKYIILVERDMTINIKIKYYSITYTVLHTVLYYINKNNTHLILCLYYMDI